MTTVQWAASATGQLEREECGEVGGTCRARKESGEWESSMPEPHGQGGAGPQQAAGQWARTKRVCMAVSMGVYMQWPLDLSSRASGTSRLSALAATQRAGMTGTRVAGEQRQTHPQMCSNSALQHVAGGLCPLCRKFCFISYLDCSQPSSHPPAPNCLTTLSNTNLVCFGQNFIYVGAAGADH